MRGRVCLVTGATGGIGYETAAGLARMGARVGLVGRDAAKLAGCAERIRAAAPGGQIDTFTADLSSQGRSAASRPRSGGPTRNCMSS